MCPPFMTPARTENGGNGSIATSVRNRPLSTSNIEIARRRALYHFTAYRKMVWDALDCTSINAV